MPDLPDLLRLAALREARPEAVEHLVKAGAELLLAARALLDGAEPAGRPRGAAPARPGPATPRSRATASSASTSASPVAPAGKAEPRAIGIDIGGTKIAAGVVAEDGRILHRVRVPTPPDDEPATLAALHAVVDDLLARDPRVEAIGVGAAGLVERPGGNARWAPHNTYRRLELRRLLHERTGLPTSVDNDANAAAWAEARFGAGAVSDDLVLVNVGTGIGGGLVLDGRLYHGEHGFAGELGHLIVDPDGDRCACGNRGCLEAMASGSTLGRLGREAAAADPGGRLAALAGGRTWSPARSCSPRPPRATRRPWPCSSGSGTGWGGSPRW